MTFEMGMNFKTIMLTERNKMAQLYSLSCVQVRKQR